MKYNLNYEEERLLKTFKTTKIPQIFKEDYIEHMLFIELLDFDICTFLLKDKEIIKKLYDEAIEGYNYFVEDIDIKKLDIDALKYYEMCQKIVRILKEKQVRTV